MKKTTLAILAALFLSMVVPARGGDAEKAAEAAAKAWLAGVDAGKYGESWDQAAALFRKALTREQWIEALKKARAPLGKALSRKLTEAKYTTTIPGAPAGEYVVLQFSTDFMNREGAVETVTPMKDGAVWRVSGYYIK